MIRVLILSNFDDNGGVGWGIKQAFDKYAPDEYQVRSVTRSRNFAQIPSDVYWPQGNETVPQEVADLFEKADVIHMMDRFEPASHFKGYARKARVFHAHGTVFRQHHEAQVARCRREGVVMVAAIHDLLKLAPDDLTWLPNPCDVEYMQGLRAAHYQPGDKVRVCQTPTSLEANGTIPFMEGMVGIPDAELLLIRNLPWTQCMERKARADVVFDSFNCGYGISTIEAWGMGIPVIHGSEDVWMEDKVRELIGFTPYYHATPKNIGCRLREMVESPELRKEYAEKAAVMINDFHSERKLVENLKAVYERALS